MRLLDKRLLLVLSVVLPTVVLHASQPVPASNIAFIEHGNSDYLCVGNTLTAETHCWTDHAVSELDFPEW